MVENETLVQVLQLLYILVKYGYYDEEDRVKDLLPSIFKFLEARDIDHLQIETEKAQDPTDKTQDPTDKAQDSTDKAQDLTADDPNVDKDKEDVDNNGGQNVDKKKKIDESTENDRKAFSHDGRYYFKEEYHYYYETKRW